MKARAKEFLKLLVGCLVLRIHRELLKCRVAAERCQLKRQLEACGMDLEIVHPWDIRGEQYVSIGHDTFIGPDVLMIAWENARIRIGSKVMFGPRVRVIANDHRIDDPATRLRMPAMARRATSRLKMTYGSAPALPFSKAFPLDAGR